MKRHFRAVHGGEAPPRRQAGVGVVVVGVPHEPPLPGRDACLGGFGGGERTADLRCSRSRSPRSAWRPHWRPGSSRARPARGGCRPGGSRARARCGWRTRFGRSRPGGRAAAACETTHVLSPSWMVPRRRDGAEVIGEALRLAAAAPGIAGSPGGSGGRRARFVAGCAPPGDALGACARARPDGSSRWTPSRSRSPRPAAISATRSRRSCSLSVRGCCGSAATSRRRGNARCG